MKKSQKGCGNRLRLRIPADLKRKLEVRRRLRQFANFGEAKAEAKIIADRLNSGKADALHLNGTDRDSYLHAVRILKPIGVPL